MYTQNVEASSQYGLYYAVWSLSLADYEIDMFPPLKFSAMVWRKEFKDIEGNQGIDLFEDIKVESDEMRSLLEASKLTQGTVLVRSPIQVFVDENTDTIAAQLEIGYSKKTENWTAEKIQQHSLVVNHVELHRAEDFVLGDDNNNHGIIQLRGPGTPLKTISIRHKDPEEPESATRPLRIDVSMINSNGTFAATLSYTSTRAFLDLWELQPSMTPDIEVSHQPTASASFPITRNKDGRPPRLNMSVSCDGSQIAVFPSVHFEKNDDGTIPSNLQFRVYTYNPSFTPAFNEDKKQSTVHQLQLAPTIKDPWLKNFAGAGKFHFLSFDKPLQPSDQERFIASDGLSVTMYSTTDSWTQHSSLELTSPPDPSTPPTEEDALSLRRLTASMIDGMRGPHFAWQATDKKSASVWDLDQQDLVTVIVLQEDRQGLKHVSFSSDGSLMSVMTMDGLVATYGVRTGTEIHAAFFTSSFCRTQYVSSGSELIIDSTLRRPMVKNPVHMGNHEGDIKRSFLPVVTHKHIRSVQFPKLHVDNVEQAEPLVEEETTGSTNMEPVLVEDETPELVDMDQSAIDPEYVVDAGQPKTVHEETTELGDMKSATADNEAIEPLDGDQSVEPETVEEDLVYVQLGSTITVYSLRKETFSSPDQMHHREKCTSACESGTMISTNKPQECITPTGLKFRLELGVRTRLHTFGKSDIVIAILYLDSTDSNGVTSSLEVQRMVHHGEVTMHKEAYFLPCMTRFLIWGPFYFQIWELPLETLGQCTLVVMRGCGMDGDLEFVRPCHHGHTICFKESESPTFQPVYVRPRYGDYAILDLDSCVSSIRHLSLYTFANSGYRKSVLKYLYRHINMRTREGMSIVFLIVSFEINYGPTPLFKDLLEFEMDNLPPWSYVGTSIDYNPLVAVTGVAFMALRHLTMAGHLIDYCVRQAKSKKDMGYMSMVFEALPYLVEYQPDLALQAIRRSAYIPVGKSERELIVSQARVRPRPSLASWFGWNREPHLSTVDQPVFQTQDILPNSWSPPAVNEKDQEFISDVFVAPYNLLWYHEEEEGVPGTKRPTSSLRTNWFKAFFSVLGLKLRIKGSNPVKCYDLGEEFFDNPAISALLEYRWNTFASAYWRFRFICQCLYYLLVLTVTLLQVYYPTFLDLTSAYIPVVVFSVIFLWLEFQQFLRIKAQYFMSPYNIVDLIVYTLPLAGGIVGIVQEVNEVETRALRVWSFAILFIYIHILFELRVIKSVCKTVTVIIKVVGEIKVFFFIFAASIIAFTHTFLHLLWARKGVDIDGKDGLEINHHASADYPRNPFMAFSATYFFMGGRLDPVSDLFSQTDTWFHVMMIIYFFFTVILMLNVLIALVNVAFTTGDERWRVIWHENRLRYIESAENVTMNIPGFRKTHSWFPNQVYYTATQKEVEEYETKYGKPVTSQLAREDNSIAESHEVIRKFVAMQVPLRPLNGDGSAAVVVAEVTVNTDIAVEAEERPVSVAVEADVVVTNISCGPTPVGGSVLEASNRQDRTKGGNALEMIQQRLDTLQAQCQRQQEEARQREEASSRREEALQKQLQDIMALLLHQSPTS
ncbi:hypothetical protein BG003_010726 [Podila horticola]|nr:hypothetical protein BG003_010726 [Podila horticola]